MLCLKTVNTNVNLKLKCSFRLFGFDKQIMCTFYEFIVCFFYRYIDIL